MAHAVELDSSRMVNVLNKVYEAAISGKLPGSDSVIELAEDYKLKAANTEEAINQMVKFQIAKCGVAGFVAGLGGLIALPVAVPVNVANVLYVQVRMIAAIAYLRGYPIESDQVKTLVYACLCGNGAVPIIKNAGITIGKKITLKMIKKIPGKVLIKINQKVGFRLITKMGEKGVFNLAKGIPVVGGATCGAIDVYSTKVVANVAQKLFVVQATEVSLWARVKCFLWPFNCAVL